MANVIPSQPPTYQCLKCRHQFRWYLPLKFCPKCLSLKVWRLGCVRFPPHEP